MIFSKMSNYRIEILYQGVLGGGEFDSATCKSVKKGPGLYKRGPGSGPVYKMRPVSVCE